MVPVPQIPKWILLVALLLGCNACGASAQASGNTFKTPSGNIFCYYSTDDEVLRCDIAEYTNEQPEQPSDCELDWGGMFAMTAEGKAGRICAGDTVTDDRYPVLEYGSTWRRGNFRCMSERSGLRCVNKTGSGWLLRRSSQELFSAMP